MNNRKQSPLKKLNLGCGNKPKEGWINLDRVALPGVDVVHDMTNVPLPFPDNYFDAIYTTETLSHSPNIRKTLKEFFRILKPGGRVAFFEYALAPDENFSAWERKMLDLVIEGSAMMGLKDFRHDKFTEFMQSVGFKNVKELNITENIRPSFYRLHKLSIWPYKLVKLLFLQKFFINITAGYEYYKMADKGLICYCIFTGNKPTNIKKQHQT